MFVRINFHVVEPSTPLLWKIKPNPTTQFKLAFWIQIFYDPNPSGFGIPKW